MNIKLLSILLLIMPVMVNADCSELLISIKDKTGKQADSARNMYNSIRLGEKLSTFKDKLDQYSINAANLAGLNMQYDNECANPPVSDPAPESTDNNTIEPAF